jgi:hypothetical protein
MADNTLVNPYSSSQEACEEIVINQGEFLMQEKNYVEENI